MRHEGKLTADFQGELYSKLYIGMKISVLSISGFVWNIQSFSRLIVEIKILISVL